MKMMLQPVFRGLLLAMAMAAIPAFGEDVELWATNDIPAWAQGDFSGRAEGWVLTNGVDKWVDPNPKARVSSVRLCEGGLLTGTIKIGDRTFKVSAGGLVKPTPDSTGFIDFVEFINPSVDLVSDNNLTPATNVVFELENMADDFEWDHDEEATPAPRARIWMRFFLSDDEYEVELFRDFAENEVPQKIKDLKGAWVYDGESTNKWTLTVDEKGNASLRGITDEGRRFTASSMIIDYGRDYFGDFGAYFCVPATENFEGVDVWIGISPEDDSADSVDAYTALRDMLAIVNDDGEDVTKPEDDEDDEEEWIIKPSQDTSIVEVAIPASVNPSNVTLQVTTRQWVKANGARIQVFNREKDVTLFLDLPPVDEEGWLNLDQATIKPSLVQAVFDPEKGAELSLDPANPVLKTAPTQPGFLYSFRQWTSLEGLSAQRPDCKEGDGKYWELPVTIKGGNRAFYSVTVEK